MDPSKAQKKLAVGFLILNMGVKVLRQEIKTDHRDRHTPSRDLLFLAASGFSTIYFSS